MRDSAKKLVSPGSAWSFPDGVTYLNHGSFGPSPKPVLDAQVEWTRRLEQNPMTFLIHECEDALEASLGSLAKFVGTSRGNLVFVDNATFAMNIVAASVELQPGDEVLLNDHEYGAVLRIWRRRCQDAGARLVVAELPDPPTSHDAIVERLFESVSDRTRLIVISHVTSPTALVLPVEEVCRRARERGIVTCVDGPHALATIDISLRTLDCDFYCASCHKWLSAPFGSGFLFVNPRWQKRVRPAIVSWGGSIGGRQPSWKDEFVWLGTRNPAAFLATAAAVDFFDSAMLARFREHSRGLTELATRLICEMTGRSPIEAGDESRCPSMISLEIPPIADVPPPGQRDPLQNRLREEAGIEIPIVHWQGRRLLRVSAHLYNSTADIDHLAATMRRDCQSSRV
ncbi:MAG: aminotransferase class V-fold PLP-dependent enzyme [Planctomycetota bacterium]|nr:aminotransferase class V-fold PLP-dependent enzyme [Planctomycetota bacterium]MDA1251827.1 aminotransferase class V-fold PLP-dependent enzyme [Planctomycetota bacterium]